jgi:hypothetical protein
MSRDPLSRVEYEPVESTFVLSDADGLPLHEVTIRYPGHRAAGVFLSEHMGEVQVTVRAAPTPVVDFASVASQTVDFSSIAPRPLRVKR